MYVCGCCNMIKIFNTSHHIQMCVTWTRISCQCEKQSEWLWHWQLNCALLPLLTSQSSLRLAYAWSVNLTVFGVTNWNSFLFSLNTQDRCWLLFTLKAPMWFYTYSICLNSYQVWMHLLTSYQKCRMALTSVTCTFSSLIHILMYAQLFYYQKTNICSWPFYPPPPSQSVVLSEQRLHVQTFTWKV